MVPQVLAMNCEHITMFSTFIRFHRQFTLSTITRPNTANSGGNVILLSRNRIETEARKWEAFIGDKETATTLYKTLSPALFRIISEEDNPKDLSDFVWNVYGDNMNWRFIDQALCWGWHNSNVS